MKAAFISSYGPIENVNIGDLPKPDPREGEVLVQIMAASVNPIDWKQAKGELKPLVKATFPLRLGSDGAGIIAGLGAGVEGLALNQSVYFRTPLKATGSFAEYICVPSSAIAIMPKNMSFEEAATIPLVGLTAMQAMQKAGLKSGFRVLIHAGGGGVGSFAIQYAKAMGAYVITTASQKRADSLKALGADEVIDYRSQRIEDHAKEMDIVLDTLGSSVQAASFKTLKRGGVLVSIQGIPDPETVARIGGNPMVGLLARLNQWKIQRKAARSGAVYMYHWMNESGSELAQITTLIEAGRIRAVIDSSFPLARLAEAFARSATGQAGGKIVVGIRQAS